MKKKIPEHASVHANPLNPYSFSNSTSCYTHPVVAPVVKAAAITAAFHPLILHPISHTMRCLYITPHECHAFFQNLAQTYSLTLAHPGRLLLSRRCSLISPTTAHPRSCHWPALPTDSPVHYTDTPPAPLSLSPSDHTHPLVSRPLLVLALSKPSSTPANTSHTHSHTPASLSRHCSSVSPTATRSRSRHTTSAPGH